MNEKIKKTKGVEHSFTTTNPVTGKVTRLNSKAKFPPKFDCYAGYAEEDLEKAEAIIEAIYNTADKIKLIPRPTYDPKTVYWVHRTKAGEIRLVDSERGRVIEFKNEKDLEGWEKNK